MRVESPGETFLGGREHVRFVFPNFCDIALAAGSEFSSLSKQATSSKEGTSAFSQGSTSDFVLPLRDLFVVFASCLGLARFFSSGSCEFGDKCPFTHLSGEAIRRTASGFCLSFLVLHNPRDLAGCKSAVFLFLLLCKTETLPTEEGVWDLSGSSTMGRQFL